MNEPIIPEADGLARAAREWFSHLPKDIEGTERYSAMKDLVRKAQISVAARQLLLAVYHLIGTGEIPISCMHDAHMVVAVTGEDVNLVPLVKRDLERMIDRYYATARGQHRGLLNYIVEIAEARRLRTCA